MKFLVEMFGPYGYALAALIGSVLLVMLLLIVAFVA